MGDVIRRLVPEWQCHAAYSADSASPLRRTPADVLLLPLRQPKTRSESFPAAPTSRRAGKANPSLEPSRRGSAKSKKCLRSRLCLDGLAFTDSIMDDKSMQAWITPQLTPVRAVRTIADVSRPTKPSSPASYRAQFFQRIKAARTLANLSPPEMAQALGVPKDTYYRYEERTMLPHHLVPVFCQITGVTAEWLMTGTGIAQARLQPTGSDK